MSWSFPHTTLPTDLAVMLQHINGIIEIIRDLKKKKILLKGERLVLVLNSFICELYHSWHLMSWKALEIIAGLASVFEECLHPEARERTGGKRQCMFGKGSITYLHILLRQMAETVAKSK